jgi:hypothetical protein
VSGDQKPEPENLLSFASLIPLVAFKAASYRYWRLEKFMNRSNAKIAGILFCAFYLSGCSPSVKLEAPEKPIEITMNVKIEHEIRLKVEKDVDELINSNQDLF